MGSRLHDLVEYIRGMGSGPPTVVEIPLPPSVNHCYRQFRGRTIKSRTYREWIKAADTTFHLSGRKALALPGRSLVCLVVYGGPGWNMGRDLDNLLKPVQDWIRGRGFLAQDNCGTVPGCCSVYLPPEPGTTQVRLEVLLVPLDGETPSRKRRRK